MKMPDYIRNAMNAFPGSFINHNNELILIPKFNVYFLLEDVENKEDFLCKMCEWISRDCCYSLRYKYTGKLIDYYRKNTAAFNKICGTDFNIDDMAFIYRFLGNAIRHSLTMDFARSGFDLQILRDYEALTEVENGPDD